MGSVSDSSSFGLQATDGDIVLEDSSEPIQSIRDSEKNTVMPSPGINEQPRFICRLTEKETYYFFESQHITHHQEVKEQKSDKQNKKVLKAAYQNCPNNFEQEPSELHSDIDKQEDMMFSDHGIETKLSNTSALRFSAAKIPPRWHQSSASTHVVPTSTDQNVKGQKVYSGQYSHLKRW
ncbi:hypothetical protein BDR07DRAFT_1375736 [Suillus spraguei]|nr:hypothetical protein BDR07DRAFT_1375736 [Suillus spraguei]